MTARSPLYVFVYEWRYSVLLCCVGYLLCSGLLFTLTGLTSLGPAEAVDMGFQSDRHLLGLMLLMGLFPSWLIGCMFVTQRNSLSIAQRLDPELADRITAVPGLYLWAGFLGGLTYALAFNVPITQYELVLAGNGPMISIFLGQVMVWVSVGYMLAIRLYVGSQFNEWGKQVPITIFEQSKLQRFARVGLLDVAIVVGSMAVSTVQSIDAQFRIENYLSGLLVAVPAALVLLIRPMWAVHRRLLARKVVLQDEIRRQLEQAPESTDHETVAALEFLLKRRDRVNALHTWPLDFAIWSRLFFYGLIPPLAWLGAALVEIVLERALG